MRTPSLWTTQLGVQDVSADGLQAALVDFRRRQARANNRQVGIQHYCCAQLAARKLLGAEPEVRLSGAYRSKDWDVAITAGDEPQLAISCKSIIGNHGGTVPNRIDDLLGEAVNIHRRWPRAVLGYLFMMSEVDELAKKVKRRRELVEKGHDEAALMATARQDGARWFEHLAKSVTTASGRTGPEDLPEKFEAVSCALIGFDVSPPFSIRSDSATLTPDAFFDELVVTYHRRFS